MMLEAGSNPRLKNKGGLTAYHLVDPSNAELRELIQKHEYASLNRGDFVEDVVTTKEESEEDEDAEFSGSDEEERAEWERRRRERGAKR